MSVRTHSTGNGHEGNPEELQNRGLWIPADILLLLTENKLSSTEVLLLAIIDGLVRVRGHGCWATNESLGNKLGGVHKSHVGNMISKMTKMGLVIHKGWKILKDGRHRLIETSWSRITMESNLRENPEGGLRENPEESNRGKKERKRETPPKPLRGDGAPSRHSRAATYFQNKLRGAHRKKSGTSREVWEESFRKLEEVDGVPWEDCKELLRWYCKYLHVQKEMELLDSLQIEKKRYPSVRNGEQFRKHFEWIRDIRAMQVQRVGDYGSSHEEADDIYG